MHLSPVYHIQLPLLALSKSKTAFFFFFQIKKSNQVERETRTETSDLNCSASIRLTTNQNHVPGWKILATKKPLISAKRRFPKSS